MDLTTLRPTDTTAAAIGEALQRAQAAQAQAAQGEKDAKQRRDSLLLDGEPKQLATADKALAEARSDGERVEAVIGQLQARHAAAEKAEVVEKVHATARDYSAADAARAAWWRAKGPMILEALREGHRLTEQVVDATWEYARASKSAEVKFPDIEAVLLTSDQVSNASDFPQKVRWWAEGEFSVEAPR